MALNFDLDDLLAFRAVAELGNFRWLSVAPPGPPPVRISICA